MPSQPAVALQARREPASWSAVALDLGCGMATAVAAFMGERSLAGDLTVIPPLLAMMIGSSFMRYAVTPIVSATAAVFVLRSGAGSLQLGSTLVLAAAAVCAAGSVARRMRFTRHTQDALAAMEARCRELDASNTARREASEVAEATLTAAHAIAGAVDSAEVALRVAESVCVATGSTTAAVLLRGAEQDIYRIAAVAGGASADTEQLEVANSPGGLLDRALRDGTADERAEAIEDPVLGALVRRCQATSLLAVGLKRGDRAVGALLLPRRASGPPSPRLHRILTGIAVQAAAALESAALVHDLRTASTLKEEFMATMSHELRTPLNVIIGYTDLQREGMFGDLTTEHLDTLGRVREQSVQLLELIQSTLDMSRLERGLMTVELQDVTVRATFERMFAAIPPSWRKANVDLRWRVDSSVPTMRTDPAKLEVILRNLIHNALKFTKAGQVTATATAAGSRVNFVVQDSGVGIAPEHVSAIFEMFRQVDGSDARAYGGVGLGLYIVNRLVTLLGGEIEVRSAPDRGSTFVVRMPVGGPYVPPRPPVS